MPPIIPIEQNSKKSRRLGVSQRNGNTGNAMRVINSAV